MLTELCQELRNWFVKSKYFGTFTIEDGILDATDMSLQEGQYFRIVGSVFNDGVHQWSAEHQLIDETFTGAVWSMAVPPSVVDLSERISEWINEYGSLVSSPYSSESFGGYSYTKASVGQGFQNSSPTWQSSFASELNRWRKI